jgi:hypothetical protein
MLAMIAGLGALFALILAAGPVRDFFELELLTSAQWFLSLACVAVGLVLAAIAWRLPYIQRLEVDGGPGPDDGVPGPTHVPRTGEHAAVRKPGP